MTGAVVLLTALAHAMLAVALGHSVANPAAPFAASLTGTAWVALHLLRPRSSLHHFFLAAFMAGAAVASACGLTLPAVVAAALALAAWDGAAVRAALLPLCGEDRARVARRYVPHLLAVLAASLAAALSALAVRPRFGFAAAAALAVAALALLAAALWQSGRLASPSDAEGGDKE
ncbi:MAG: hypothetical protein AB1778_04400 [Candidatus Bipolaricaulota bacterium]